MTRSDQYAQAIPNDLRHAARSVAATASLRAAALDHKGAFPAEDLQAIHRAGLLIAPFPAEMGGCDLGLDRPLELLDILVTVGSGNLALGRLYEGHINAVKLVRLYGNKANLRLLLDEAEAGFLSGVWMAERGEPLRLERSGTCSVLAGQKVLASGAGYIRRPLVAALDPDGESIMLMPFAETACVDTEAWDPLGMQATATGTVDFSAIGISADEIVGRPGDYLRAPHFKGGAWRVLAVQLGGLQTIMRHYRDELALSPFADHPLQLVRYGEAVIAFETARLWVKHACLAAEQGVAAPHAIDATVDFARNAFEASALRVIAHAQKAIGLKAFLKPGPLERLIRDLTTYLRQPGLDLSLMSAAKYSLHESGDLIEIT